MRIFDRWGHELFYTNDLLVGWSGTARGKTEILPQDVHIWNVEITDVLKEKHYYVGHVTLLR